MTAIFSPEHGYKGIQDDATGVDDAVESVTGLPLLSLWGDEGDLRPTEHAMTLFDVLVVDIQDVGLRYYTYYITLCHLMDARGAHDKEVILLDRPNPNGHYVDAWSVFRELGQADAFFTPFFDLLLGQRHVREMILQGYGQEAIRARWADDLAAYRPLRQKYLLYED